MRVSVLGFLLQPSAYFGPLGLSNYKAYTKIVRFLLGKLRHVVIWKPSFDF